MEVSGGRLKNAILQAAAEFGQHDLAHAALLLFDGECGVDDVESHLLGHGLVLVEDPALENAEALLDIAGQPQIHPRLVVFEGVASAENSSERHIERYAEVEGKVGV